MARPPKCARITEVFELIPGIVELRARAEEALMYAGGAYIIARTDLPNPEKPGEVIKRAWSLAELPDPADPCAFTLRIEVCGEASRWLAGRSPGDILLFSGPWGRKFRFFDGDRGPVHLVAAGTGLSPIGTLAAEWLRDERARDAISLWWQTDRPYRLEDLEALAADERFGVRVGAEALAQVPLDPAALYFLAGDGALLAPLAARLAAAGVSAGRLRTEYFFNRPS